MGKTDNYYTHVASLTVLRLKEWAALWQKSWKGSYFGALPMNPITGRRYRAGNLIQLMLQEHADPRWLTYQQAQRVGAPVSYTHLTVGIGKAKWNSGTGDCSG